MTRTSTLALTLITPLLAPTAAAQSGCDVQALTPPIPAPGWAGYQVLAVDDEVLVADVQAAVGEGRVHVYRQDTATGLWSFQQTLTTSIQVMRMWFGADMTHDDGVLVVSGPLASPGFNGAAFVFERDPATGLWVETQVLTEPGTNFYGAMVELDGDLLAVSHSWANGMGVGYVYVYRRDPAIGRFVLEATIDQFVPTPDNRFAQSAAFVDEDTLLLGDADAGGSGTVRILRRNPAMDSWDSAGTIDPPTPNAFGSFGASMAWDGRQLVVSETRDDDVLTYGGATHVFEPTPNGGWTLVQTLRQRSPSTLSPQYGYILDLEDGQLWLRHIGADAAGMEEPRVDRWLRDDATGEWRLVGELTDPLQTGSLSFGISGAVSGSTLVVGDSGSGTTGRAFAFDLSGCGELGLRYCDPATPNSTGAGAELAAFGTVFTQHGALAVRATNLPSRTPSLLLASQGSSSSFPANSVGRLCLGVYIGRFPAVLHASDAGSVNAHIDTSAIPTPLGNIAIQPGDTWNLQLWYRDSVGSQSTSNFTSAVQIAFQ